MDAENLTLRLAVRALAKALIVERWSMIECGCHFPGIGQPFDMTECQNQLSNIDAALAQAAPFLDFDPFVAPIWDDSSKLSPYPWEVAR